MSIFFQVALITMLSVLCIYRETEWHAWFSCATYQSEWTSTFMYDGEVSYQQ